MNWATLVRNTAVAIGITFLTVTVLSIAARLVF